MRQLRLKPLPFASPEAQAHHETEWAAATQALAALPMPPGLPPVAQETFGPVGQRHILSIAKQYQNQGLPPLELVQAGHSALVKFAGRWDGRPKEWQSFWVWWVRGGIVEAVAKKAEGNKL